MEHSGPWRDLRSSGLLGGFVVLCLGVWLHAADTLVTATIVPAIVDEIGGIAYVGWTISLYQIGAIVAGAATAMLCQRAGVKRVLLYAAVLYGSGCSIAAISPAMVVLLAARLLQGTGGGMLISLTYVAIQYSFAERFWSRLFGVVAMIWGAGSLLGPLIGGVFSNLGAWRWAFWFFAAQAGVLIAMAAAFVPYRSVTKERRGNVPYGALLAIAAATLAVAQAGVVEQVSLSVLECLIGLGLLYVAARLNQRSHSRLLPEEALDLHHPLGAGLLMVFALSAATTGFWAYGPLILKIMFGIDPLLSGLILAGEALAWSCATIAVSSAQTSTARSLIRAGTGLIALGAAGFALTVPIGSLVGMVICALLQGTGFGLCWPSIVHRTVQLAAEGERHLAAAAPGIVQRIGYAVGAAATGIAANMSGLVDGSSIQAAKQAGFWIFAGFIPLLGFGLFSARLFIKEASERVAS
jgi:MFS family permease